MKSLKGTETEKNLLASFAGESQARMRYTYFASKAKKKDMSRYQRYSRKPLIMRRSTRKSSSSTCRVEMSRSPQDTPEG